MRKIRLYQVHLQDQIGEMSCMKYKPVKEVKQLIAEKLNDKKLGISVSIWQPEETDMDRIVIKFPRYSDRYVGLTPIKEILEQNKFHVAQVMGFMEHAKLWILLIRDKR